MSMKLLSSFTVAAYRCFSTNSTKYHQTKFNRTSYKKKFQNRYNDDSVKHKRSRIKWTDQQQQVLDAASRGQSVFISGSAGTGKTLLVQHIIKQLKKKLGRSQVFVTASTGMAACAIHGQTLHSFAGIGFGEADPQFLVSKVVSNRKAYRNWKKVEALVIDEISMIDAEFFDKVEFIARTIREKNMTWGGIQLVVSGDFFQLPPVPQKNSGIRNFAFEADCWESSFDLQVDLMAVFRQSEANLVKLLQGIRRGETDSEDLQILGERCSEKEPESSVVRFYPRNEDASRVNSKQLQSLGEEIVIYRALDIGNDGRCKTQLKYVIAPDELKICIGARVMLTKNLNTWRKLVNGATGTVMDFKFNNDVKDICESQLLPEVKFDFGGDPVLIKPGEWVVMDGEKVDATRKQLPLMLAWALSVHKCQGMTLDSIHTNLSRAFDYGMVYVALSRVRSLSGLHLSGFNPSKIKAHPKVLQFYERFESDQNDKRQQV